MSTSRKDDLVDFLQVNCMQKGNFHLNDGWKTETNFDLSRLVGLAAVRRAMFSLIEERCSRIILKPQLIGCSPEDYTLAAVLSLKNGIGCFSVDSHDVVVGHTPMPQDTIMLFCGVMSSGQTMLNLINYCNRNKITVMSVMSLIDMSPDGQMLLFCRSKGLDYLSLLTAADFKIKSAVAPPGYASMLVVDKPAVVQAAEVKIDIIPLNTALVDSVK